MKRKLVDINNKHYKSTAIVFCADILKSTFKNNVLCTTVELICHSDGETRIYHVNTEFTTECNEINFLNRIDKEWVDRAEIVSSDFSFEFEDGMYTCYSYNLKENSCTVLQFPQHIFLQMQYFLGLIEYSDIVDYKIMNTKLYEGINIVPFKKCNYFGVARDAKESEFVLLTTFTNDNDVSGCMLPISLDEDNRDISCIGVEQVINFINSHERNYLILPSNVCKIDWFIDGVIRPIACIFVFKSGIHNFIYFEDDMDNIPLVNPKKFIKEEII